MHKTHREKYSCLILASFIVVVLSFSLFSNGYAAASIVLPSPYQEKLLSVATLDEDDDDDRRSSSNNYDCLSDTIKENLDIVDEDVKFLDCEIRGNIKIDDSHVKFTDSKINGNVDSDDSSLVILNSEINGNVHAKDGTVKLIDSIVRGNLQCDNMQEFSIEGSSVKGNIQGCHSDEDGDDDDDRGKDKGKGDKGKNEDDDNHVISFPTDFTLEADRGFAIELIDDSRRFNDVSMQFSGSTIRLEGNHIRASIEGVITLDEDTEFELNDGRAIIVFFKNPDKHFFRGIIHITGEAVNPDDESEKKFHLRALLLPPIEDEEEEGIWTFVVHPVAKLGSNIRIFGLVGELIAIGDASPPVDTRLDHFVVSKIPSSITSGKLFEVTVTAVDANGKLLKSYEGKAGITDLTGTVKPTTTANFDDGTFTGKFNITKSKASNKLTFTDIATNKKGTSNAFDVIAASLADVELTPSAVTIQPGQKADFVAKGTDKFGNEISGFDFGWSLSSPDFGAISTNGNKASFTASSTLKTKVDLTITVQILGENLKDSSKITISPETLPLDHFTIDNISGPKTAGSLFQITVRATDSTGDPVATYAGPMKLTGTLNMTTATGFTNGVWTGNVNITKASSNAKITAHDVSDPDKKGTSNGFEVKAAELDHFEMTGIPNEATAGVEFALIAKAMDRFGNVIKDYDGNVTLSTNNGASPAGNQSELSPNPYTFNSDDEGQHTFQIRLFNAKEDVTITISDSEKSTTSSALDVVPASIAKVIVSPHSVTIPQGERLDFKAKAQDAFGNVIAGASFTWNLSSSSIGSLSSTSGSEVEFVAVTGITESISGSIIATSGSASDSATVTVTSS